MMTRFVKINNSIFKISKTLADSLKKICSDIEEKIAINWVIKSFYTSINHGYHQNTEYCFKIVPMYYDI